MDRGDGRIGIPASGRHRIKNRGVADVFIAYMDGLKGFPESVTAVYPQMRIRLCIVRKMRNSTKYVSRKERKFICADLKKIHSALPEKSGLAALDDFSAKRDARYPMILKSWRSTRENLNELFSYPTDGAIFKVKYLALTRTGKKWTTPIRDRDAARNQVAVYSGDRVAFAINGCLHTISYSLKKSC